MSDEPKQRSITIEEVITLTLRVEALIKLAEKHEIVIFGNGNEEKSILYRLAQLEQAEKRRNETERDRASILKSVLLPIIQYGVVFIAGGLAYILVTHLVK